MKTIHVLSWLDIAVLLVILWCGIDSSRLVQWKKEPLRAFTFLVATVGTLGYACYRQLLTVDEAAWTLVSHFGFMLYAIQHLVKRYQARGVSNGQLLRRHLHRSSSGYSRTHH